MENDDAYGFKMRSVCSDCKSDTTLPIVPYGTKNGSWIEQQRVAKVCRSIERARGFIALKTRLADRATMLSRAKFVIRQWRGWIIVRAIRQWQDVISRTTILGLMEWASRQWRGTSESRAIRQWRHRAATQGLMVWASKQWRGSSESRAIRQWRRASYTRTRLKMLARQWRSLSLSRALRKWRPVCRARTRLGELSVLARAAELRRIIKQYWVCWLRVHVFDKHAEVLWHDRCS